MVIGGSWFSAISKRDAVLGLHKRRGSDGSSKRERERKTEIL